MDDPRRKPLDFNVLADEIERRLQDGADRVWPEQDFDTLAARVFRFQFEHNDSYRALCERRGVGPETVRSWRDTPAVPAAAFKHLAIRSHAGEPEAVFRTSGTTRGAHARGRHFVPRLSLYEAALVGPFRRYVMTGLDRARFLSLVPSPEEVGDSSLSWMVGKAASACARETLWLVDGRGGYDVERLSAGIEESAGSGEAVVLVGTALAFLHVLEALEGRSLPPLHPSSRVMETGGFKGARREVSRDDLHRRISTSFGLPIERIVNEYGMTELLSQLYEPVLGEGPSAIGVHVPPPWLQVRALDPTSLDPVPEGRHGVLAFFDLANLGSVSHVLTQDVGSVADGRVRLGGRLPGAEARGCSRAMDELMSAARSVR